MSKKTKQFADDGWAIWIDGDDRSTIYLNEWLNPKGKSYVDIGVRAYGAKNAGELNIYVPFKISREDVTDLSVKFKDDDILRGMFNTNCIIDTEINKYTSELKYDGREVSLINFSDEIMSFRTVDAGAVISFNLGKIREFITCDEAYVIFRLPHKTLDKIFADPSGIDVGGVFERFKSLISSPVVTRKYGYSIRINEARLLPKEINRIEVLQQQRIQKALVTISIGDEYELNDANCYRIRRLEENLYKNYAPPGYSCADAVTYQWVEERDKNMKAHYNFYFDIVHNTISKNSVILYILILLLTAVVGNGMYDLVKTLIALKH